MSKTITFKSLNEDVERAEAALAAEASNENRIKLRTARENLRIFSYSQKKCFTGKGRVIRY